MGCKYIELIKWGRPSARVQQWLPAGTACYAPAFYLTKRVPPSYSFISAMPLRASRPAAASAAPGQMDSETNGGGQGRRPGGRAEAPAVRAAIRAAAEARPAVANH